MDFTLCISGPATHSLHVFLCQWARCCEAGVNATPSRRRGPGGPGKGRGAPVAPGGPRSHALASDAA